MKNIIAASLITLLSVLGLQALYVKLSSGDDLYKTIKTIRDFPSKNTSSYDFNKNIKITSIKTGYYKYRPTAKILFKNNTNKDITGKNYIKAVFIVDNKVYSERLKIITSSMDVFPAKTEKEILFNTQYDTNLFDRMYSKGNPKAKIILYLNNKKYKELPVKFVYIQDGSKMFQKTKLN